MNDYTLPIAGALVATAAVFFLVFRKSVQEPTAREVVEGALAVKQAKFDELAQGVGVYYDTSPQLSADDREYQYNFHSEELLKLLISLDSIDLLSFPEPDKSELKAQRKLLIKGIQLKQKELDKFKAAGFQ